MLPLMIANTGIATSASLPNSPSHIFRSTTVRFKFLSLLRNLSIDPNSQPPCLLLSGRTTCRCYSSVAGLSAVTQSQQHAESNGRRFTPASVGRSDDGYDSPFSALKQLIEPGDGQLLAGDRGDGQTGLSTAADVAQPVCRVRRGGREASDDGAGGGGRREPTRVRRKTSGRKRVAAQVMADGECLNEAQRTAVRTQHGRVNIIRSALAVCQSMPLSAAWPMIYYSISRIMALAMESPKLSHLESR